MLTNGFRKQAAGALLRREKPARMLFKYGGPGLLGKIACGLVTELGEQDRTKPYVLCMSIERFDRDIEALMRFGSRITWASFPGDINVAVQKLWMPRIMQSQMKYTLHGEQDYARRAWAQSLEFFLAFLRKLIAERNLKAVITGNTNYWEEEALRVACKRLKIPCIALSREYSISELWQNYSVDTYRGMNFKFKGDIIAAAGRFAVDYYVKGGVVEPERVRLAGHPRTDLYTHGDTADGEKRKVTMLSYGDPFHYAHLNMLEAIIVFSWLSRQEKYKHLEFVVKCKDQQDLKWFKKYTRALEHNYRVDVSRDTYKIIKTSRIVIGYGSTAVWEALLTGAQIVVPHWYDTVLKQFSHGIHPSDPDFAKEVYFPRSAEEFRQTMEKLLEADEMPVDRDLRKRLFRKAYFLPEDGKTCSESFEQLILDRIDLAPDKDYPPDSTDFQYEAFEYLK